MTVIRKCIFHPLSAFVKLLTRTFYSHGGVRTVHHRNVQPEAMKYGAIVTCLICFVFRCFQGWECSYTMRLNPSQQHACQALNDVLGGQRAIEVEEEMWSFMDGDMRIEVDDNDAEDLDEEK
jgi:hypothetical protein